MVYEDPALVRPDRRCECNHVGFFKFTAPSDSTINRPVIVYIIGHMYVDLVFFVFEVSVPYPLARFLVLFLGFLPPVGSVRTLTASASLRSLLKASGVVPVVLRISLRCLSCARHSSMKCSTVSGASWQASHLVSRS
ncbi:hypothetical protein E4T56_gene1063 [Termitomyces sp. T112]|nr:hypothetical protein E4T56_gene1063 [Termitomyces sp. T112]